MSHTSQGRFFKKKSYKHLERQIKLCIRRKKLRIVCYFLIIYSGNNIHTIWEKKVVTQELLTQPSSTKYKGSRYMSNTHKCRGNIPQMQFSYQCNTTYTTNSIKRWIKRGPRNREALDSEHWLHRNYVRRNRTF